MLIDEVQKVPALLDEVHWLMRERSIEFVLCGSSPRKLLRSGGGLLGGRALRYELHPLVYPEIPAFDLLRALNHGLLPPHYLSDDPGPQLHAQARPRGAGKRVLLPWKEFLEELWAGNLIR